MTKRSEGIVGNAEVENDVPAVAQPAGDAVIKPEDRRKMLRAQMNEAADMHRAALEGLAMLDPEFVAPKLNTTKRVLIIDNEQDLIRKLIELSQFEYVTLNREAFGEYASTHTTRTPPGMGEERDVVFIDYQGQLIKLQAYFTVASK